MFDRPNVNGGRVDKPGRGGQSRRGAVLTLDGLGATLAASKRRGRMILQTNYRRGVTHGLFSIATSHQLMWMFA